MSVRSGQSITEDFTTHASSGALTNADSLPTGTLVLNGTDNAATVTVTNKATGVYKAAVTLPTLAVGDVVQLRINATVGGIADGDYIWEDSKDVVLDGNGFVSVVAVANDTITAAALATDAVSEISAAAADRLLGRNLAGGSDGGRTVQDALRVLRNRWSRSGGTLTVYAENDTSVAWTSVITLTSVNPITESDPA